MSQSPVPTSNSGSQQPAPTGDGAPAKLRKQIEFYFSPGNLARDRYLVSILQQSGAVMIGTIANFPKVREITSQLSSDDLSNGNVLSFIASCLQDSQVVAVSPDRNWILPRSMLVPTMMPMGPPQHRPPMPHPNGQYLHHPSMPVMPFPQQPHHSVNSPNNAQRVPSEANAGNENNTPMPSQPTGQQQATNNVGPNNAQPNPIPNGVPQVPILIPHAIPMYVPMHPSGPGYYPYGMPPMGMYAAQSPGHNNGSYYSNGNGNRHHNFNNNRGNGGGYASGRFNRRNSRNIDGSFSAANRRNPSHSSNGNHQSRSMSYPPNSSNPRNQTMNDQNESNKKQHQSRNNAPRQGHGKDHHKRNNNTDQANILQQNPSYIPTTMDFPSLANGGEANKKSSSSTGNYAAALLNKSSSNPSLIESGSVDSLTEAVGELNLVNESGHIEEKNSTERESIASSQLPSQLISEHELAQEVETGEDVNAVYTPSQNVTAPIDAPPSSVNNNAINLRSDIEINKEQASQPEENITEGSTSTLESSPVEKDKMTKQETNDSQNTAKSIPHEIENKTPENENEGVWASKRLFADVSSNFIL